MPLRILHQDEHLVIVDKPAGFQVHPHEEGHALSRETNCLYLLKKQLGQYLYPVHRLDRATSGVLCFALTPESAGLLQKLLQSGEIRKTYYAVTRGWTDEDGLIDHPLKPLYSDKPPQEARSIYQRIAQIELPHATGRYATTRLSLVRTSPLTGRTHQLRRHFAHLSHPLIGDSVYGDGKYNRFFKEHLKLPGLFLKAYSLEFRHPFTDEPLRIISRWSHGWHQLFDVFGVCPWGDK